MTTTLLSNILIIIGVIWIIAGYFTYMQTIKLNKVVHELGEKADRLYSGKNAGFPRTRRIAFAADTNSGTIVDARILKAAFIFKPAKVVPFPELIGKNLNKLDPSAMGLDPLMEKTMYNVLKDFHARNSKKR